MPKTKHPNLYERLLTRPRAWAGGRTELAAAAACVAVLLLIFVAETRTPSSVVGILAAFPLVIATWMLSHRVATGIAVIAIALVIGEVALHAIDELTGAVEVFALATIAGVVRLYASRFDLLFPAQNHASLDHLLRRLSKREREVVQLTINGHTAPQIADLLHISERTVESHLANSYIKLGISSKFDLVRRAVS